MQILAKICGILYDCDGKPGSNYPDLEQAKEFWNQVWVPGSDYKSLVDSRIGQVNGCVVECSVCLGRVHSNESLERLRVRSSADSATQLNSVDLCDDGCAGNRKSVRIQF